MKKKTEFINPNVETETIESLSLKLLQANKALQVKNHELELSEKMRKDMLANISHDLRAPITAIRSALELLNTGDLSGEALESTIGLIDRRVHNLEGLIQDLYFLGSVEDDLRKFDFEAVNLGTFLENYFFDATVDSRYDNHDMQLDVPMDMGVIVNIDIQKTVRVLDNLFTNAAKYSGDGSTITLRAYAEGETATIIVEDNGVGIASEDLSHIFEPSYTVSSSRTPGVESGSGLGLSIARAVIEKENGTIICKSEHEKGSSFIIELPIKNSAV